MRALIALIEIVYLLGVGVASTTRAEWNDGSASEFGASIGQALPNALAGRREFNPVLPPCFSASKGRIGFMPVASAAKPSCQSCDSAKLLSTHCRVNPSQRRDCFIGRIRGCL